ncbi:DUF4126 domain-containing protein [Cerasicoccus frondis]|uniref:DUF4126 domain-containing protein n=1 Tax=Cerasicoccus frondis TaxID=490090 RepID=UPI0028529DE3|nr:DUF4126 domain-containing protein [Cerasicoccus frondis]
MAVLIGVCLAAACGFRVFVPLFVASLAANTGVDALGGFSIREMLGPDFQWLGNTPVTITLGVATGVEIVSYYVPWLDNALDSIATPAAVAAGTLLTGALMPEAFGDGSFKWFAALIAGGGAAGAVQGASVITRGASTATTGGAGNPIISTAELGGAIVTAALAVLIPVVACIVLLIVAFFVIRAFIRFFKARAKRRTAPAVL